MYTLRHQFSHLLSQTFHHCSNLLDTCCIFHTHPANTMWVSTQTPMLFINACMPLITYMMTIEMICMLTLTQLITTPTPAMEKLDNWEHQSSRGVMSWSIQSKIWTVFSFHHYFLHRTLHPWGLYNTPPWLWHFYCILWCSWENDCLSYQMPRSQITHHCSSSVNFILKGSWT